MTRSPGVRINLDTLCARSRHAFFDTVFRTSLSGSQDEFAEETRISHVDESIICPIVARTWAAPEAFERIGLGISAERY